MTIKRLSILLVCAVLVGTATVAIAQDDNFDGAIRVGYRSVDTSGSDTKYQEDVNLDDGPRLFELYLNFMPEDGQVGDVVDRVRLDINNFGGEPFETLSLDVEKFNVFDFRYDRRKSEYFYNDVYFDHPDFHTFDFERVQDSADLDLDLTSRATLTFGFDRFTKQGESTYPIDISREEFDFDKPVDETLFSYQVGFSYEWDDVTLTLEERIREYENVVEIFLPGASTGLEPGPASLDFYFLNQPYDYSSNEHVARVVATPGRWTIRGQALFQDLDLDVQASERGEGLDFRGNPLAFDNTGSGEIERETEMFDVDFSFLVTDRVAIIGGAYQRSLDQDGQLLFGGAQNRGLWEIDTTGLEGGVEFAATSAVTVTVGARWENREVTDGALEAGAPGEGIATLFEEETDHTGYFGTLAWRPVGSTFRLTAEVDSSSYDDPFTLASPTDRLRYRLRASYGLGAGFSVSGSFLSHTSENDNSGWDATYDQANLRLGYNRTGLEASLGYALVDVEREIDQVVVTLPGFGGGQELPFPIFYEIDTDFIDGRIRWTAAPNWEVGGSFLLYENDGSFGLERDDFRAFVDYVFPAGYTAGIAFRTTDYSEQIDPIEDYDADIIELSVGYRW